VTAVALHDRVTAALKGAPYRAVDEADGTPCIGVAREHLHDALERLKGAGFGTNTFVTAVDLYPAEPRFQVTYQFLSLEHNGRIRVLTPVPGDDAVVPTCTDLWPGASFSERECYDMFGIRFDGHGDLRRLLMPEEYGHHPLRKDFPHEGIEPDRLYREWDAARRAGWSDEG
jgi:NADH-quinone oxidoreductase subunit C